MTVYSELDQNNISIVPKNMVILYYVRTHIMAHFL